MGILLRAARHFGEDLMFEPSGPALWARIRGTLESFLEQLWREGALSGSTAAQAFEVRCDESSMTQSDIDAGRVICRIGVTAAYPIERITVSLLLLQAAEGMRAAA
jgi:phage tail sheath protein FI